MLGYGSGMMGGTTRAQTAMGLDGNNVDFAADSKMVADGYDPNAAMVGSNEMNDRMGFSLGISTADAKPITGVEGALNRTENGMPKQSSPGAKVQYSAFSPGAKSSSKLDYSPTRSIGDYTTDDQLGGGNIGQFEAFSRGVGREQYKEFVELRSQAKDYKVKAKEEQAKVNEAKHNIDRLVQEIEARKSSRIELMKSRKPNSAMKYSAKDELVDEEEFRLAQELKEVKIAYKQRFEQMQKWKKNGSEAQMKVDYLKSVLASRFNEWSSENSPGKRGAFSASYDPATQDDQLDDQEAFDKMEMEKVLNNDPESLAFFHAQKTRTANITQSGGMIKQQLKNKRFA